MGMHEEQEVMSIAAHNRIVESLRQQLTPLGEFCETLKERIVGLENELNHEKAVSSRTEVVESLSEQNESLRQQFDAANTLINKYREETTSLRQQLADSQLAEIDYQGTEPK